ncbi:MAG: TIGR04552 family protein, partial [Bdellovibrionales bacterium]|nr:TIGR04552 family protein [Bdellovibrionales bacterium]
SSLTIPYLNIQSLDQAKEFVRAYGYDLDNPEDVKKLWKYHRRAVTYIQTEILDEGEEFPENLSDPNQLNNLCYLLIYASTKDHRKGSLQNWACATLKVMHVLVHLDNDLFSRYFKEIQEQILRPIQNHIYDDPILGSSLGKPSGTESIPLKKFVIKPFKSSDSSVTKLLAKPEAVAFTLLDKMGVRFITKHLFDSFRVMRYLNENSLISFPHNIPDQSNNTLYPSNIFLEVMETLTQGADLKSEDVDQLLYEKLELEKDRAIYRHKKNQFSGQDYRFLKFITRRLIRVKVGQNQLSFFYPFEVQIIDYASYLLSLQGNSSHVEYKKRQKHKARVRILGLPLSKGEDEK